MRHILLVSCIALSTPIHAQADHPVDPEIKGWVDSVNAEAIEKTVRKLASFGTRHTLSDPQQTTRGIGAARRWIRDRMVEDAKSVDSAMQVAFETWGYPAGRRVPNGAEVVNVVGTLKGTDPHRWVIVSGHYDSRASRPLDTSSDAPGADDDASGTAVVMEAARVLARMKPRANVLFMCVAGEEQGLLGAMGHAQMARKENRRIEAMFTNDIVGGVIGSSGKREPMRVRLFSEGVPSGPKNEQGRALPRIVGSDNDAPSRQVARYLKSRGEAYVKGFDVTLVFRQDRYLRGGDHRAFNDEGFPGVRFTECHENYSWQHQDVREKDGKKFGDLPDNLDYDFVRRVCQVNVAGLAEIALAPASPRQVRVLVSRLTPHTELLWATSPENDLASYAVLSRRTHEPTWTHRRVVSKNQNSVVMEGLSKDDWLFAVEAVDTKGRRSIPVYPTPSYGQRRR